MFIFDYNGDPVVLYNKEEIEKYLEDNFKGFNEFPYIVEFAERACKETFGVKSTFSVDNIELSIIPIVTNALDAKTITQKKSNVEYWDHIDNRVVELIECLVRCSYSTTNTKEFFDSDTIEAAAYSTGLVGEIRDKVIGFAKSMGGYFPYIDKPF